MINIFIKKRTKHFFFLVLLSLFLLVLSACYGVKEQSSITRLSSNNRTMPVTAIDKEAKIYSDVIIASHAAKYGMADAAIKHLSEALKCNPESVYLNLKIALILKEQKKYNEAIAFAQKAFFLAPDEMMAKVIYADILNNTGDKDNASVAAEIYEEILDTDPDNLYMREMAITNFMTIGDYEQALKHIDYIIDMDPDNMFAYYYRGRAFLGKEDLYQAEQDLVKASSLFRPPPAFLFDLAVLYQTTNRFEEAAQTLERLLLIYPKDIKARETIVGIYSRLGDDHNEHAHLERLFIMTKPGTVERIGLGVYYLNKNAPDKAIEELEQIIIHNPAEYKAFYFLAAAYEEKDINEKALELFSKIPKTDFFSNLARIRTSIILQKSGNSEDAIAALESLINDGYNDQQVFLLLAAIYEENDNIVSASGTLEKAVAKFPDSTKLIFQLAVLFDKLGEKEKCLIQMQNIIEKNPNHAEALNYVGYTWAEQGIRLDEAEVLIRKALEIKPDSAFIIDSLAWVYYQKGDYVNALDLLKKAVTFFPEDPVILEHFGDAYYRNGNKKEAVAAYRSALDFDHPEREKIVDKIQSIINEIGNE